jgi:hypothetical protein
MVFTMLHCSSHHWYASACETLQCNLINPQMDVGSVLYSKDVFVPPMNLTFGKSLSLTTMAKVVVFPFLDVLMPNSPMSMLDICDWLLFVVSTTVAGSSLSSSLLSAVLFFPLDGRTGCTMKISLRVALLTVRFVMVVSVLFVFLSFFVSCGVFQIFFFGICCIDFCVSKNWRAPAGLSRDSPFDPARRLRSALASAVPSLH